MTKLKKFKVINAMKKKCLSLYIHIPFCVRKCHYCDFLSVPADEAEMEAYIQALLMEIESYRNSKWSERSIRTLFIGGGTPSVLSEKQITSVFDKLKDVFCLEEDCEITIEANPGTVTKQKSRCYFDNGINRISIGLQSTDDQMLRRLGRIHTYDQFLETYAWVRDAGINNVNIDMMSALPGQNVRSYCEGLEKVMALEPDHISAYSLIIEEGTPFWEIYHNNCDLLPSEQEDREMYEQTKELLSRLKYERYEISNYARGGYECRHNIVYWERDEYLGLGLGSSSLLEECRFKNSCDLKKYIEAWKSGKGEMVQRLELENLSVQERMEEFMFLGLRMRKGISYQRFYKQFLKEVEEVYGEPIFNMIEQGLLEKTCNVDEKRGTEEIYLRLTDRGIDVSNRIFEQFLL